MQRKYAIINKKKEELIIKNWTLFSKLTILAYIIYKFIYLDSTSHDNYAIIAILFYIIINILFYMINSFKVKRVISLFILTGIFVSSYNINQFFLLLIPPAVYEIMNIFGIRKIEGFIIPLIMIPFISGSVIAEFVLVTILSYFIYKQSYFFDEKVCNLSRKNDDLRENNYILSSKLIKESDYQEQLRYLSQLEERNRIAQQIHDELGHTISASLMQLEASKLLMRIDSEKAFSIVQSVIDVLRKGMEEIRKTLKNIKPQSEQLGLNRLKLILEEFSVNTGIDNNLVCKGNLNKISYLYWKIMLDNLNESLTNITKYSKADCVNVKIEVLNKLLKLEIKDNGVGAKKIEKGLGMKGIEERSESVGGRVIVDGSDGFSIIALLPLEEI